MMGIFGAGTLGFETPLECSINDRIKGRLEHSLIDILKSFCGRLSSKTRTMIRGVMHPGTGSSGDQKKRMKLSGVRLGHVGLVKQEHKGAQEQKFWFSWDEGEPGWALRLKSLAGGV